MCQMFEFPFTQGILGIEDTQELPSKQMSDLGYKVQNLLIDDRMDGNARTRSEDALRVSLRLGESAIVLGEVRGDEVSTLYQSMRTGKAGSSIMGTMHGDSAKSIYERVVHDMGIAPEAFMATDFIAIMGTSKERGSMKEARRITELVSTGDKPGKFVDITGADIAKSPAVKRIASSSGMRINDVIDEIMIRADMRGFLAEMSKSRGEEFAGPKWTVFANDYLARQLEAGARDRTEIVEGFKARFRSVAGLE